MEPQDRDQLDDLLDGALRQYGNVEPRAGLERRVLANLTANAGRMRARSVWAWALAGACAMVLVVGMWVGIGHRRQRTAVAVVQPKISEQLLEKNTLVTEPIEPRTLAAKRPRPRLTPAPLTVAKAAEPRLQQFPSPRPLTQQEVVIAEYVEQFPEEAKLIVQEQKKFDDEVQQAQQEVASGYRNYDNQER